MSLNYYADVGLTLKVSQASPKRFLIPSTGGTQPSRLWLGDPYTSTFALPASSGAGTVFLTDTGEFFDATQISGFSSGMATAIVAIDTFPYSVTFNYTGKTQSSLTGVTNLTSNILEGAIVYPAKTYFATAGALSMVPIGPDLLNYGLTIALGTTAILGFPGLPAIYSFGSVSMGVASAVELFLSAGGPAGVDQEFFNWGVQANNLFIRDVADTTPFNPTEPTVAPVGSFYGFRHDQYLQMGIRVLPVNRQVQPTSPGFIVGQYRWRDQSTANATALVPTTWANTPQEVGLEKFIAGIGFADDLEPIQLNEVDNSIYMTIEDGEYFTGANRYYLPADPVLEFKQTSQAASGPGGTVTFVLEQSPRPLAPIFVGTYSQDSQGFYETALAYEYIGTTLNPDGSPRTDLPPNYFTLDRATKTVTLNKFMDTQLMFLGVVSGQPIDYFNLPIYPVDQIITVYVDRGANEPFLFTNIWTYNQATGTLQVPAIAGALAGQGIFASASPAVAVLYDTGPDNTREITTVDFNPAFSGLASGYFYLQHRLQTPTSLVLSADKPRIDIPATESSIIGLVAYGPVYFTNDYALLTVTAFGALNNEKIPNALLQVVVDPETFTGTINYVNPLTTPVQVVTGGDGTANLIFIPQAGFGIYIPTIPAAGGLGGVKTTHLTNDTLVLPEDVPLSELWNVQEGWLVTTYTINDSDPLFGMVGGNPALGEIPFMTMGTPGAPDYSTNGEKDPWYTGVGQQGNPILPIDALDVNGHSYTSSAFNGNVRQLVYPTAVPSSSIVGAYFITFIQRVLIKMQLVGSDVFSNSILLQMGAPPLILQNPWLILNDSIQGILNTYRLGFVPGE